VQVSEIIFFLLGAMTIVEIVDAHQGFRVVTDFIKTKSKKGLMWTIGILAFVMSSVLDNLTTTIVMVSLLRKLVPNTEARRLFGALVVIAANAGGAWTPIGDVTTTMLWINGQITALATMKVRTPLHSPHTRFSSHSISFPCQGPPPSSATCPTPSTSPPVSALPCRTWCCPARCPWW
jgi:Na+/H+ antiporter NhaD/arsenite permease-like protein